MKTIRDRCNKEKKKKDVLRERKRVWKLWYQPLVLGLRFEKGKRKKESISSQLIFFTLFQTCKISLNLLVLSSLIDFIKFNLILLFFNFLI
jgi:hypothetical protein